MKIFFIVNGGRKPVQMSLLEEFRGLLRGDSALHRMEVSLSLEHAHELVEQAAAGDFDTLWVGGGDGTIHVLLNQALGRGMTFGVVPMGTVNALARSLGIPLNPIAAVKYLLQATPQPMDVGLVNGTQRFLCFASIGFDAAVVHDVSGAFKRRCGRFAYFLAGVRAVFSMNRVVPFQVVFGEGATPAVVDSECRLEPVPVSPQEGFSLMLSNVSNYAGFCLFHDVRPCSGTMEFWLFRKRRLDSMLGWAAATGIRSRGLQRRFGRTVGHYVLGGFTVTSKQPMYLQLDGEAVLLGNNCEYRFECLPGAAQVLIMQKQ
ncbi:MAG: diacylglycerol/lipid kinase family protein [Candidatus Sumerlaeaceae bacterium]